MVSMAAMGSLKSAAQWKSQELRSKDFLAPGVSSLIIPNFSPLPSRTRSVPGALKVTGGLGRGTWDRRRGCAGSVWRFPFGLSSTEKAQKPSREHSTVPKASGDGGSDVPAFKGFPPMQTRPAWYWRIAAVAPYFLPLLEGWLYSETAMTLYAPLFHYKVLCSPIVNVFAILPSWFLLAYFFTAYLGVVRNNRWPHFLRFHVVMGMLMEIILQVVGTLNDWIPPSVVWGRFGSHFWLGATLAYIFIVLECILSALKGMYADVPFISDAAYLQIPYE